MSMLRSKWMAGAVALALVGTTTLAAVTPADAQWRGRHGGGWHHRHGGGGGGAVLGGLAAGALLGGAIAASRPGYGYGYGPGYYAPPPAYYGPPPGDDVAYCMNRFKSYDPASGTYLGYDGYRHPCP
jgi:hypothetical protein